MNKVWTWIKERVFVILLLLFGVVYFTYTDNWQIYLQPVGRAGEWCLNQLNRGQWKQPAGSVVTGSADVKEQEELEENLSPGETDADKAEGVVSGGDGAGSTGAVTGAPVEDKTDAENGGGDVPGNAPEQPLPVQYISVEEDYFSDAVFIGDSRTVGMYEYGGLDDISTFYAATGLTIYKLFDASVVEVPGQRKKLTIEEALQENSFQKIYLMIGINEMGTGTVETFIAKYKEAVERLQELQPEAIIYLQGIMKVTTERSEQGDYIHNEGIEARNAEIAKLADERRVFYLDVNPLICDETGGMEASYTFDGVHLKAQYVSIWKEFLKAHAVEKTP